MRVPIDGGSVKLKNGKSSKFAKGVGCTDVSMIGPVFGDLDDNGTTEAFFVVNFHHAAPDLSDFEDAHCLYSEVDTEETLYAYELSDRCAPKRKSAASVGDCPQLNDRSGDACKEFKLQIRGGKVVYGRDRFKLVNGALEKAH